MYIILCIAHSCCIFSFIYMLLFFSSSNRDLHTKSVPYGHTILARENFGKFGETNIIHEYFTHPNSDSLK